MKLFIFNRYCECIFSQDESKETEKLVFGVNYSTRNILNKLDASNPYFSYSTNAYKLYSYKTLSNLTFILITPTDNVNGYDILQSVYSIYVNTVVKNQMVTDKCIGNDLFRSSLLKIME